MKLQINQEMIKDQDPNATSSLEADRRNQVVVTTGALLVLQRSGDDFETAAPFSLLA
jgi:hypothetical protein